MALHFSKEEFSKRKQDVLKSMKEQNLDALLMFRQESMYWLTGYDTMGFVFFQTLIINQEGKVLNLGRVKLFFVEMISGQKISCPPFLKEVITPFF